MTNTPKEQWPQGMGLSVGVALGCSLGIVLGLALNNLGLWLPICIALGLSLGAAKDAQTRKNHKPTPTDPSSPSHGQPPQH